MTTDPTADPFPSDVTRLAVRGVELHYLIRGSGQPVVLVHGAGDDLRYWTAQMEPLTARYRVVAYSRRFAAPNRNTVGVDDQSAVVEAEDLAALLDALGIDAPHLIGHSYGAQTALLLALRHPERARTLTLVEPPLVGWAADMPNGPAIADAFRTGAVAPAAAAFRRGDIAGALRTFLDFVVFDGFFDGLPALDRNRIIANARDIEAMCTSPGGFPVLPLDEVRRLRTPTLLFTGSRTAPVNTIGQHVLSRNLPVSERVVVENASHEVFVDDPATTNAALVAFLARHGGTP